METINYDLKDLHKIQKDLLLKLISVCNEHKLEWYLGFGSLLGAVREHRIIAWDDSIDVVMPYSHYNKLINLPEEVWGENIFMQTYYSDPEYPKCYAKLRSSNTTLIKADYASYNINQGIYINIMPIINLSDDKEQRRQQIRDAKLYKAITEGTPLPVFGKSLGIRLSLLFSSNKNRIREKLKENVLAFENENTEECFVLAGNISLNLALRKTWFESAVIGEFEGIGVNLPKGWNEWLTLRYGDYMLAPISDLQDDKIAKFVILNTKKPYTEYKGKSYCV